MANWDADRGVWRIVATVSRPGEKRRRKYRDFYAPNTKVGHLQAEIEEDQMRLAARQAIEADLPGSTSESGSFGVAASEWVNRRPYWSPKTIKETKYALARYILPVLGSARLHQITPAQIEDLYANWTRQGFSASTTRRWHGMLRAIFADLERLGQLQTNPMSRVRPVGGRAPERRPASPADVRAVIAASSTSGATFFELAAATGARRGTLVALRWREVNIDGENTTVTFAYALTSGEQGPVLKGTKANRPYVTHLAGPALTALREHRRRCQETAMSLGITAQFSDLFVFSSDGGITPWAVGYPSSAWRIARERAGVDPGTLHDLRHFAATTMLGAGVPIRVVAERLGCTEANIFRTYSHYVPTAADARAAEVMANALSG